MCELVELKDNVAFTTSRIIADGTKYQHHAVQQLIRKYESAIAEFGQVAFEMRSVKYARGTNQEKVYLLNEHQATFLMTLMRNDGVDGVVVGFKKRLVKEFIRMENFIKQKNSTEWDKLRTTNKGIRKTETDTLKELIELAKSQGSTHSDKIYMSYTKLAKMVADGKRDEMSAEDLSNITAVENLILHTIRQCMLLEMHYKDIYKECKEAVEKYATLFDLKIGGAKQKAIEG